jgi:hypothetical protein
MAQKRSQITQSSTVTTSKTGAGFRVVIAPEDTWRQSRRSSRRPLRHVPRRRYPAPEKVPLENLGKHLTTERAPKAVPGSNKLRQAGSTLFHGFNEWAFVRSNDSGIKRWIRTVNTAEVARNFWRLVSLPVFVRFFDRVFWVSLKGLYLDRARADVELTFID